MLSSLPDLDLHNMWLIFVKCIIPSVNYGPMVDVGKINKEVYNEMDRHIAEVIRQMSDIEFPENGEGQLNLLKKILDFCVAPFDKGGLQLIVPGRYLEEMAELQALHLKEPGAVMESLM